MFVLNVAELAEQIRSETKNCTVFIAVNDAFNWVELMRELSGSCMFIDISEDCACADTPPVLMHTLQRLKTALRDGDVVCRSLEACLRLSHLHGREALVDWLLSGKSREHRVILPMLACPEWFADKIGAAQASSKHILYYELAGERDGVDVCALDVSFEPPVEFAAGLRAYFAAFEAEELPRELYVRTCWPLLFNGGWNTHCCTRAYAAVRRLTGEFPLLEQRAPDETWAELLPYADDIAELAEEYRDHGGDVERCAPCDPMHFAQLMLDSQALSDSEYLFEILRNHSNYADLSLGVALAIFNMRTDDGRRMLELRCQRATLIRELGIERMPELYWEQLARVDRRSKLLYTSLVTDDERQFCEDYLLRDYHLNYDQLIQRDDLRSLYPEMLASMKPFP